MTHNFKFWNIVIHTTTTKLFGGDSMQMHGVNTTILKSIPIDKGLKSWIIKRYETMVSCNGYDFACERFKEARVTLMKYRADLNRLTKKKQYAKSLPFKYGKRSYQMLEYMDTCPHALLCFMKLYLGSEDNILSVEESAKQFHQTLNDIPEYENVPEVLATWFSIFHLSMADLSAMYDRCDDDSYYGYAMKHHTKQEWLDYWSKWKSRVDKFFMLQEQIPHDPPTTVFDSAMEEIKRIYPSENFSKLKGLPSTNHIPSPWLYKDFKEGSSESFNKDLQRFFNLFSNLGTEPEGSVNADSLDWIWYTQRTDKLFNQFELDDLEFLAEDGSIPIVGEIHHIPKNGTNTRRPIAVPNRFLQSHMVPLADTLYQFLQWFPRDHTFDQTASIDYVQHRLNTNRYTCSVDLSKATDTLPFSIFQFIWENLVKGTKFEDKGQIPNDLMSSYNLYLQVARGQWKNGDEISEWKTGQPLGTIPSFAVLALSHNFLLESIALSSGYLHSPYNVLGDDVLLFSKRMRRLYIETMTSMNVPLSLHKSYEGNLVEFAGKIIVKNVGSAYVPDPRPVTWSSLFDYGFCSGIYPKYEYLTKDIRSRLTREGTYVSLSGGSLYQLLVDLHKISFGAPGLVQVHQRSTNYISDLYSLPVKEETNPDPAFTSGWEVFTIWGEQRLGFFGESKQSLTQTTNTKGNVTKQLPLWFKTKYRPCSTTTFTNTVKDAVLHHRQQVNVVNDVK